MAKNQREGGLWKASPKLRRFAQQSARDRKSGQRQSPWQENAAVQQAGIKYESIEDAAVVTERLESLASVAPMESPQATQPKARFNVYLQLNRAECKRIQREQGLGSSEAHFQIDLGNFGRIDVDLSDLVGTASVDEDQLQPLIEHPVVESVDIGEAVRRPLVSQGSGSDGLDSDIQVRNVGNAELHRGGENVLIGIIDVDGFDFSHDDFLNPDGTTRFVRIWDQGGSGTKRKPPTIRGMKAYGSELSRDAMNEAMELSKEHGIAAYHIEPQSSTIIGSHGTHVASIAAGKQGICPHADIAAVLIHLPEQDLERSKTFSDSTRIADAIAYLLELQQLQVERYSAISINISLGTNGHAHDGTSLASRWIDSEFGHQQGRCICIAAGNAGQEKPESVDDLGFVVGRIHTSGTLDAAGLTKDIQIQVAGFPIEDISENEIEIWYAPQDRIDVSVRPPSGGKWTKIVCPGDAAHTEVARDASGEELRTDILITSEIYRAENGNNRISVFLTPQPGGHVEPGAWTIRLHAREIRDGHYDGWIERDDPIPVQGLSAQKIWHYPSFFVAESNVDRTSISTLACTRTAISVANVDDRAEKIAISSSQGPTRDGQLKPELGAPGTRIVAANGFHPSKKQLAMTGTSMASPFVAGVAGLMLAVEPKLTPSQIRGIMIRTARPLPGANYDWRDDAGYGLINAPRCIEEVRQLQEANRRAEL